LDSSDGQERAAHGVVPWARSPSTVAAPVEHRRPSARHSIGDRSCASSTTTWARLGVRVIRSRASSMSTRSAADHRADPGPRGAGDQRIRSCSASVSTPPAASASAGAEDSSPNTSRTGSTFGQIASTAERAGLERRTDSCVRSSQASPAASIRVRITCAIRCSSSSRAAP
jgi:hypothetical protein